MTEGMRKNDMLKVIAMISMFIDHVGYGLVPTSGQVEIFSGVFLDCFYIYYSLRIMGRLAFPIFAWYLAEGFQRTKNVYKYMTRIFVFGIISQWPFYMLTG